MKRIAFAGLTIAALAACADASLPTASLTADEAAAVSSATTSTTHFAMDWPGATAQCGSPIGNIRFSGWIEGVDHTTVDGRGETHRTRVWRVKGLSAVNLSTGTEYVVVGGAEMLTWHTHLGQVPGNVPRSIHAGTLVFQPLGGGAPVVAHHRVHFMMLPGSEVPHMDFHSWSCTTRGMGRTETHH
jgi:hypothetical protein